MLGKYCKKQQPGFGILSLNLVWCWKSDYRVIMYGEVNAVTAQPILNGCWVNMLVCVVMCNRMQKKWNLPFEVGYVKLKTIGMDLLPCLCGSY